MDYEIHYIDAARVIGIVFNTITGDDFAVTIPSRDVSAVESLCETLCVALQGSGA